MPLARRTRRLASLPCWAALCAAALTLWPAPEAQASGFDIFGLGARATAMGGAQGADARDYAAAYYNPGLLTARKRTHFGLTLQLVAPDLTIDRPPTSATDADGGRSSVYPETNLGLTLGVVFPLGGRIEDRLAFGLVIFTPMLKFTRVEATDPASPHFVMYQSLPDKLILNPAVAAEPIDGLHIGAGAQILAALDGETRVDLDTTERRVTRRTFEAALETATAPVLGIAWRSADLFSAGLTYRGALDLRYRLPITFAFEDVGDLDILVEGTSLYTPAQLNLGVAVTPPRWTFALDLTFARWSQMPSPAAEIRAQLDDSGLFPDAEEPSLLLDFDTADLDPGFTDILIPRLGVEHDLSDRVALRGGYALRPTPVPNPVGYTNLLDATAHQLSVGASVAFQDPLDAFEEPLRLDAFVQVTALPTRRAEKIPARDPLGIGSFEFYGALWNLGLELHVDL